jgi:hypothetical protein
MKIIEGPCPAKMTYFAIIRVFALRDSSRLVNSPIAIYIRQLLMQLTQ